MQLARTKPRPTYVTDSPLPKRVVRFAVELACEKRSVQRRHVRGLEECNPSCNTPHRGPSVEVIS